MDQAHEVMEIIDDLYGMVSEAWGVPLGNEKCIVERDKLLNLLDEIKDKLPAELAEARRLVQTRNEFITNAKDHHLLTHHKVGIGSREEASAESQIWSVFNYLQHIFRLVKHLLISGITATDP